MLSSINTAGWAVNGRELVDMTPESAAIGPDDFDTHLDRVLTAAADPTGGLFGPESVVWQVNRFTSVSILATSLGGHLDAAHPWVAFGVVEHSKLFERPMARFEQTYILLNRIVFGDTEHVRRVSRSLYSRHGRVEGVVPSTAGRFPGGSRYAANSADALLWVHVVYFWTRYRLYELTVGSLPTPVWDRYVVESRRFGACFGIPDELMPDSIAGLRAAVEDYASSDRLASSAASVEILAFLRTLLPRGSRGAYYAFAGNLLPASLASILGLPPQSARTRMGFALVRRALQAFNALAPGSVRYLPAYHEALERIDGRVVRRPTRLLNQALCKRPTVLT